ncbi:Aminopeptidase N [Dermatophilus congolensis]|uniref:Aminopeptidase N n=3 Tax=Dermatophilus congolensis TaxID=1863 RepID=A0A239VK31_9MICO|nr:aminopeptidase N [Dermatophilus congolensis]SNV21974.1 Aminopeptidase N [Dermatophilus congolensis]
MPAENLTRQEAAERAELLKVHEYNITLALNGGPTTFSTRTRVRFDAVTPGAETFIDFIGPSVESITLNGRTLNPAEHFADSRIRLTDLAEHNELDITATGAYMNSGEGLHRFVDPADDQVYLYTQFEVADTRRVFPVFEQPDLKATFQFTVTAPREWEVISTQNVDTTEENGDNTTWTFPPTAILPPYVTAVIAGPYASVSDSVTTGDGRTIPLRLLARRSLMPHLDTDNIFDITKRGFDYYEKEFDLAYPFDKYDQIFTPEYNFGAMENVGAVTFNEMYVFRGRVTEAIIERRALTILHELAHMWFGNLVTMRWWNDLWLNESFAEWASTAAQAEATRWTEAWTTFAASEKAWAYDQDQRSTTHPIVAPIRDLEDVVVNFDGITYAKGASVLKQLVAYVGREAFTTALRNYFNAYAYGNTTLTDLLAELEAASGRQLSQWSSLWLETAGVNTLHAEIDTADTDTTLMESVRVIQTATTTHPTLRPHTIRIGLYDLDTTGTTPILTRRDLIHAEIDGESTEISALAGLRRPDLLLLNDDDLGYAKVRLDDTSLTTVMAHPHAIVDSLARAVVLGSLWDMTRDAALPARTFINIGLQFLADDLDSTLRRSLISQITTTAKMYVAPHTRDTTTIELGDKLAELANNAQPGSDAQLQLVTAAATWATTDTQLERIRALLDGTQTLPGLDIDTEMRWTLLTSLAAGGRATVEEIAAEEEKDRTATGRERGARARASIPTAEAKEAAWARAIEEDSLPNSMIEATAQGFVRANDLSLLTPYIPRYHAMLRDIERTRTHAITESIVEAFYPAVLASRELLEATQTWLEANTDAPDALLRLVNERRDVAARALAAQERDAQS